MIIILLLLRRPSKKNILDDVLSNIRFDNFERKNFKFIEYFNMEYISLYALMDENLFSSGLTKLIFSD